ncbi:methylated-DNA--[protein]-cysteine S-methyltransferase [Pseudochrobactrum asaccharolyticum]|uniref:methylated-DNA--[protein]-cysteine S-methyltransferase n=1 Tax=Pseudochrobactrum asaccharolyticum TaxID=354351 RepID=A0A366DMD6_9HYPH|nr:methylated-DNA--[protein]-cysteine S-methyltransferase [Pseudochrobactrum asaccharolyticum]RBO91250.1 methylated-DNA-[protein]-cysteine S-methyltransferase [Pseudochrobactrum asaccharolyticum]
MTDRYYSGNIETPIGTMIAIVNDHGAVMRLDFDNDRRVHPPQTQIPVTRHDDQAVKHVAEQLHQYFARERRVFDLPLAPIGTPFLKAAWLELAKVPYGTITTYGELAKRTDHKSSARAYGRVNAINPISIIVPCHRVIGANGKLTGYSGGLDKKEALLQLEGCSFQARLF